MAGNSGKPRIFVSYSGRDRSRDKPFVREFLYALRRQSLDVWVYEKPDERVPEGVDIGDYCRSKIAEADLFIAFVTRSSIESPWTRVEVAFAFEQGKRIFPIKDASLNFSDFTEEYKLLKDIKFFPTDCGDLAGAEIAVHHVLDMLEIPMSERLWDDPSFNFGLAKGLKAEIQGLRIESEFEMWIYHQLRVDAEKCCREYLFGSRKSAMVYLERVISTLEIEIPAQAEKLPFYYPYLLRYLIKIEESQDTETIERVSQDLHSSQLSIHPWADENLEVLQAMIQRYRGEIHKSLSHLERAEQMLEAKREFDPELAFHLFWHRATAKKALGEAERKLLDYEHIDSERSADPKVRSAALLATKMMVRGYLGDVWPTTNELKIFPVDLLELALDCCFDIELSNRILVELEIRLDLADIREKLIILRRLGIQAINDGKHHQGILYLRNLVEISVNEPSNLRNVVLLAQALHEAGDLISMRDLCDKNLSTPTPRGGAVHSLSENEYLIGHLHWLRGEHELACLFFMRSGYDDSAFYEVEAIKLIREFREYSRIPLFDQRLEWHS